jgi:two-component system, NtrC family, sensor kinase
VEPGSEEKRRVLVIDDEEPARYGMIRVLRGEGYEVEEAGDGEAALQALESFQPGVVVSDINMPRMDGLVLLRHVQELEDAPLVILVTAYSTQEMAIEALRAGAYNYLRKPFEIEELRVAVRNALEKRHLIEKNRFYYEELERTLAELRHSQAALVQSEKMSSLGRLVAGLAHEIHTPLGVLQSTADTMERAVERLADACALDEAERNGRVTQLLSTVHEVSGQAKEACTRLHKIVGNLRQFAQIDRAEFQHGSIHSCINTAVRLIEPQLPRHIRIERRFGEVPEIGFFPAEFNQMMMNLLWNAEEAICKAERSEGVIVIGTALDDDLVMLEVEDNGCGIPESDLESIFDPGFTTKGSHVGAGLGLAICYQVVQAHRGSIVATSSVGCGSKFSVRIPTDLHD